MSSKMDRRKFAIGAGLLFGGAIEAAHADAPTPHLAQTLAPDDITHDNAAIRQKVVIAAEPAQVYRALTDSDEFDKVVHASGAMNSAMGAALGKTPTMIEAVPGGAFALFGGYVTGRNIELLADTRLVQAWRAGSWAPSVYSIVRFDLAKRAEGTEIDFMHTGFPNEAAAHLAAGWHANYWDPLARILA